MSLRPMKMREAQTAQFTGPRPAQEDAVLALPDKGIFVVADGFGGPAPGRQAAQLACDSVRNFLIKEAGDLDATLPFVLRTYFSLAGNVLFNALIHANKKIKKLNLQKNVHERGGASVLAAYLDGNLLAIANVGACGAALFRDGKYLDLVAPRTYGRLTDPFAPEFNDAYRTDVPLMALGMSDDLEPEISEYRIQPGDWLLLYTDGLPKRALSAVGELQVGDFLGNGESVIQRVSALLQDGDLQDNTSISLTIF